MPVEQLRRLQRHERILDAATRVFSAKGYHYTAVDDIALEADTSKGGIYFHFPTKESILMELMGSTADRLVAKVQQDVRVVPTQLGNQSLDEARRYRLPQPRLQDARDEVSVWTDRPERASNTEDLVRPTLR